MEGYQQTPNKGPWNAAEDEALKNIIGQMNTTDCDGSYWVKIANLMRCRSAKQCRERWHQSLKPGLNHGQITPEEADLIIRHVHSYGQQWAKIARELPGRSDNMIKNWWNGSANRRMKESSHILQGAAVVAHPQDLQRRTTDPYPLPVQHYGQPAPSSYGPNLAPPIYHRPASGPYPGQYEAFHLNQNGRRMTVPHPGYSYPPPPMYHQHSLPPPPAHYDARASQSLHQHPSSRPGQSIPPSPTSPGEKESNKPVLPSISNLFSKPESSASSESTPVVQHSGYPSSMHGAPTPYYTPLVSPTEHSPRSAGPRDLQAPPPSVSHLPYSQHSVHPALREYNSESNRKRHHPEAAPRPQPPPTINTSVSAVTSPPTEVPTLVRESATDSPPFRSPITPAYATFPTSTHNPATRNDSEGTLSVGSAACVAERCSCPEHTTEEPVRSAKRRRVDQDERSSDEEDTGTAKKKHCGGKMDLKLVTN